MTHFMSNIVYLNTNAFLSNLATNFRGTTGNDAVGISLAATVNLDLLGRNVVRNVLSASGNAYGMQVMQVRGTAAL